MENKQLAYLQEDEIDLRELVKTIWAYKIFIFVFTLVVTVLAVIYVSTKTPIYKIQGDLQIGRILILTTASKTKIYLQNPHETVVYIKNNYDNSHNAPVSYPRVNDALVKGTDDIIHISVLDFSNAKALAYLAKITTSVQHKGLVMLNAYIKGIQQKIKIIEQQNIKIQHMLKSLNDTLKTIKNARIYATTFQAINSYQKDLLNNKLKISSYQNIISGVWITHSHIIGKIQTFKYPVKPKKKLIVVVAFVAGLIVSVFLVFFLEFIKTFKEEQS